MSLLPEIKRQRMGVSGGPLTPLCPPLWLLGEASGWRELLLELLELLQGGVTDGSTIKWTSSLRSAGSLAVFTQTANGSRGGKRELLLSPPMMVISSLCCVVSEPSLPCLHGRPVSQRPHRCNTAAIRDQQASRLWTANLKNLPQLVCL